VIELFDPLTHKLLLPLRGYEQAFTAVAYSSDTRRLAGGDLSGTVRIWNTASGDEVAHFSSGGATVYALAFLSGDRELAVASDRARIWNVAESKLLRTLPESRGLLYALAVSPERTAVAAAGSDGTVWLWDLATGKATALGPSESAPIRSLAYSPDGKTFAAAGGSLSRGMVRLWDVERKRSVHDFLGGAGAFTSVAFVDGGKSLVAGSSDGSATSWSVATRAKTLSTPMVESGVAAIASLAHGRTIIAAGVKGVRSRPIP